MQLHKDKIQDQYNDGTLNGYQKAASVTAIYPGQGSFWGLVYCNTKLNGEAGEFSDKIGKLMRDDNLNPYDYCISISKEKHIALKLELGDILWYVANTAKELGYTLQEIANANIEKLKIRQEKGTLSGSGDNR